MNSEQLKVLQLDSSRGDFYVDTDCCLCCGVPQAVAPDLVGWTDGESNQCYWKKQPETTEELERAFAVFDGQDAGCHRYAGRDVAIQLRIGSGDCDFRDAWPAPESDSIEVEAPRFWTDTTFWERIWARLTKR